MSTTVTYKGSTIATVNNNTKTLKTAGKYMEGDVILTETSVNGDNLPYGNLAGLITGVTVDYENRTFTRLNGAEGLTPGTDFNQFSTFGNRRRVELNSNGTVVSTYGDNDYSETGWHGNIRTSVMVEQPKFYYKVEPVKLDGMQLLKANYYISPIAQTGYKLHPAFINASGDEVDYYYIGAYEASLYDASEGDYDLTGTATKDYNNDTYASIANAVPIVSFSRSNGTKMADNLGNRWYSLPFKVASAEQLLMMIELAGNFQTVLGAGVTSGTNQVVYTGATSGLGNSSGIASQTTGKDGTTYTSASQLSVSYRGCENPWGNIFKWVDGINEWGDGTMGYGQAYICSDMEFTESVHDDNYEAMGFTLPESNYIQYFGYVEDFDYAFIPITTGSSSVSTVNDYMTTTSTDLNSYRAAKLGGGYRTGSGAGGFYWYLADSPSSDSSYGGGRLVYV